MTALVSSSVAASAGTIPSPLRSVSTNFSATVVVSSSVMTSAGLLERGEDLACRGQQLLALGRRVVDRAQRQRRGGLEQIVGVLQQAAGPFGGGDEFRRADAAILVGINQGQGLGVELQPGRGTGQGDPELLVELIQGHEIGPALEPDLVEAAGTEEFPGVM